MKKQHGFTFIELIIVLLLTAIISISALSRFFSTSVFKQRVVQDQVKLVLKLGQKIAISQRRPTYIISTSSDVRICYTNSTPCPDAQSASKEGNVILANPQGVTVTIPSGLSFNTQGYASSSLITIPVGTSNLYIEAMTGYVHD